MIVQTHFLKRCFLAFLVFETILYGVSNKRWSTSKMIISRQFTPATIWPEPDPRGQLVDTPACRIPDLDPYDDSVAKFIKRKSPIFCGDHMPSITYEDGDTLRINWTVVKKFHKGVLGKCKYWPLIRKNNTDSRFTYGKEVSLIADAKINDEFIKVECFNTSKVAFYTNFHTFIFLHNKTEVQCEKNFQRHLLEDNPQEVLNVLLIGIDSVSRLNLIRQLPRTRKYLLEKMGAVEMTGHTKVGDNTFPNVVPILSGKFPEELPWDEDRKQRFDNYSWIWKDYNRNGYRTSYIEDAPKVNAFQYLKKGFENPPTHFYNRVFSTAMEKEKHLWNKINTCFRDRPEADIVLKQTRDFITLHRNKPHFAFTFLTRKTHGQVNNAGLVDDLHLKNLRQLFEEGLLNKTVLFFFSDHGCRYGKLRQTFVGKIEERLPACLLVFPAWFREKYPNIQKNVLTNSKRLTSHFDLYETMQDMLYFNGATKKTNVSARGISLMREIPRDRSCDQAGISPHWCVCFNADSLEKSSDLAKNSALRVVSQINFLLREYQDRCERLTLASTHNPVRMGANREGIAQLRKTDFNTVLVQLSVVTKPGLAVFESTVGFHNSTNIYTIIGDISRINEYGNQSHCIDDFHLKKFCFCKK